MQEKSMRTFVAYVEDKPGVLNRIASMFRRRAFNIISLNVGRTHEPGISRMTFVVEADDDLARRIEANLYKLVNVLSVEDITKKAAVSRDLALIKVDVGPDKRAEVLQLCDVFRARAVDVHPDTLVLEITGNEDKIDGLVDVLRPYGVIEMARTGRLAMTRSSRSQAAAVTRPVSDSHDPQVSYSV